MVTESSQIRKSNANRRKAYSRRRHSVELREQSSAQSQKDLKAENSRLKQKVKDLQNQMDEDTKIGSNDMRKLCRTLTRTINSFTEMLEKDREEYKMQDDGKTDRVYGMGLENIRAVKKSRTIERYVHQIDSSESHFDKIVSLMFDC